jgi:hypothetical protein
MYKGRSIFSSSMDSSKQVEPTTSSTTASISSPTLSQASSSSFRIPPLSYLTVPSTHPVGPSLSLPGPTSKEGNYPDLRVPLINQGWPSDPAGPLHKASNSSPSRGRSPALPAQFPQPRTDMSVYSSTSASSQYSTYSNPPPRAYRVPSFENMTATRDIKVCSVLRLLSIYSPHIGR